MAGGSTKGRSFVSIRPGALLEEELEEEELEEDEGGVLELELEAPPPPPPGAALLAGGLLAGFMAMAAPPAAMATRIAVSEKVPCVCIFFIPT
jgi:hypothetical protein